MKPRKKLNIRRARRAARVSIRVRGTAETPRLVVSRSNQYIYAQLVDDVAGRTLAAVSSFAKGAGVAGAKATKSAEAFAAGEMLGKKAKEKGIASAIFDRREARFHGRVKSFADGAKKAGLKI